MCAELIVLYLHVCMYVYIQPNQYMYESGIPEGMKYLKEGEFPFAFRHEIVICFTAPAMNVSR